MLNKKISVAFCCMMFTLLCSQALFAAPLTIRLASLVPENTAWGAALNKMAKEWSDATGGDVRLIVYHGGVISSNEVQVIQNLKQNQIQAAVLSSAGMSMISEKVITLSCPFLVKTDGELDYVLSNIKSELEADIDKNGYKIIAWSKAGWIKFFARSPVHTPADLRKQRLAAGNEIPALNDAFKALGYTVVLMPYNDILTSMSANRVDACFQSPVFVASMQIFGIAKNMSSINVAPFMGGIVLNQATWRRIPDKHKQKLLEVCARVEKENDNAIAQLEGGAIDVMKKNGLVINEVSPAQQKLWEDLALSAMPSFTGGKNPIIDPDVYGRIETLLREFRAQR
ncbi:MAG: TRAP transporter substrate-binding protein DctP [Spirochaetaceae bacterium]|nr:TRAP transporter substrate-binding protein DctP [Spirochaetaceae bacterium]